MLTISPISNNSNKNNNSQPSFGLDYARSFRKALKDNAFQCIYDDATFRFAQEGIVRLGFLKKRRDGLTVKLFQVGDVSDLTVQNKAGQFVMDIDRKMANWFFDRQTPLKKEELKASAKTRLENMILRVKQGPDGPDVRELNELLTNGKVPHFDKRQFYNKQPVNQKWLISFEYFKSPEFLKTMEESFKTEGKSKAEVLTRLKKANEPIYCGDAEKKPLKLSKKISNTIAKILGSMDDSVRRFQDWLDYNPEIFHYSKAERAKMKELRKLIDEQLG